MRVLPLLLGLLLPGPVQAQEYEVNAPTVVLNGVPFKVSITSGDVILDESIAGEFGLALDGQTYPMTFELDDDGNRTLRAGDLRVDDSGPYSVEVRRNGALIGQDSGRSIVGWLSLLPPVLAIGIALVFKRVIPALFIGIWVGAWTAIGAAGAVRGIFDSFQVFVLNTVANADHVAIILFTLMIGGMVGIISKNGGMRGVVRHIVGWASTRQRGQVATWLLGLVIFFDDYANTLVVGNTMRPITDRLRISREKLAYIVDSTAAPVACLFFVTTWIGYEVGIIESAVSQIEGYDESAYSIFLNSIPYSFYPWLTILFVLFVAMTRKDFGAMREAERRATETGAVMGANAKVDENAGDRIVLEPPEGKPLRAINAILPIVVLVGGVVVGLFITGSGETVRDIIGSANSYAALMWASLASVLVAAVLSMGQRILTVDETVDSWYAGVRSMLFAMIILVLAWALSDVTSTLQTAPYLVSVLGDALLPGIVPALIFVISAATAFATGSSWGTMGILMPLVVPLTWAVLQGNGVADPSHYYVIHSTVSCVLAGAVWGDHCSPISDTTILSSMASGCDHIEHVRTQMPYALAVGAVALLLGTVPTGFGFPWWASLLLGAAVLFFTLRQFGESPRESPIPVEAPRRI